METRWVQATVCTSCPHAATEGQPNGPQAAVVYSVRHAPASARISSPALPFPGNAAEVRIATATTSKHHRPPLLPWSRKADAAKTHSPAPSCPAPSTNTALRAPSTCVPQLTHSSSLGMAAPHSSVNRAAHTRTSPTSVLTCHLKGVASPSSASLWCLVPAAPAVAAAAGAAAAAPEAAAAGATPA